MPVISLLKLDNLFVTNNTAVVPYYWVFCIQSKSMLQHIVAQRVGKSSEVGSYAWGLSFWALQICEQPLKIQFMFLFDCLIFSQIPCTNLKIKFLPKGHSTKASKIPFIDNLKRPACASNWDMLELTTLG